MDISKIVRPGTRIEIKQEDTGLKDNDKNAKYYASRISDVLDNGDLEIYMPTDQGKVIVFSEGTQISLYFYSKRGMYQISSIVRDRYKDGGLMLLRVSLRGELKRNQRREHYRYPCSIKMMDRLMDTAERRWLTERGEMVIMEGEPMAMDTIADISGGGIKFTSRVEYEPESALYCEIEFGRLYKVCCIVLDSKEDEKEKGVFINRAQFYGMDNADREELIKYIFDLELKARKEANEGR